MKTKFYIYPIFFTLVSLIVSCDKLEIKRTEEYYSIINPILDPGFPTNIEQDSLLYKSGVTKLGTLGLKSYGICYGQKENPTVFDIVDYSKTSFDTIPFNFQNKPKNLKNGTIYQVRSFVITSKDTIYGPNNFFRTYAKNEWAIREQTPYPDEQIADPSLISTFFDDKKVYMFYQNENRLWEYDARTYFWVERKELPSTLKTKTTKYSFMLNGKGYCGNLQKTGNKLDNEFWEFDTQTNTWRNLDANKPTIQSTKCFGFSDNKFGYVLNQSEKNTWNLWRFDPNGSSWTLINEGFEGEIITNLFSDGINTFAITKSNSIHKFNSQKWEYFTDFNNQFPNNGQFGFYGGILNDKIFIGEHEKEKDYLRTRIWKSINILNKSIDVLSETNYRIYNATYQTRNKLFYGSYSRGASPNEKVRMNEYFPK